MYSDGIKKYAEKNDIIYKMKETNTPKLLCDLEHAPFIFEYVNMLSEKRAKTKTIVEKNLYNLWQIRGYRAERDDSEICHHLE